MHDHTNSKSSVTQIKKLKYFILTKNVLSFEGCHRKYKTALSKAEAEWSVPHHVTILPSAHADAHQPSGLNLTAEPIVTTATFYTKMA
jgi:hypothetical protein